MTRREQIQEEMQIDNFAFLDPDYFDEAIVGVAERCGLSPVILYDRNKCIDLLVEEGMPIDEAYEYFDFNIIGSYIGDETPLFATFLETWKESWITKQGFFIETPTITDKGRSEEEESKERSLSIMEEVKFISPNDSGDETD